MNTENFFYKLNNNCTILNKVFDFLPKAKWEWVPYMNMATNLPQHLIKHDSFLSRIPKKFFPVLRLYKFSTNSIYNWHRDKDIGCSMNMVLDDYRAFTIFHNEERLGITNTITELAYEKHRWYLFNSQSQHQVVSLHPTDRYLLTVTFPKIIQYEDVLSYFKQQELEAFQEATPKYPDQ
jgi:hypothetical protein